MKRITLSVTPELAEAVQAAVPENTSRNAALERWLWRVRDIQQAAKQRGITPRPRRGRGRPAQKG